MGQFIEGNLPSNSNQLIRTRWVMCEGKLKIVIGWPTFNGRKTSNWSWSLDGIKTARSAFHFPLVSNQLLTFLSLTGVSGDFGGLGWGHQHWSACQSLSKAVSSTAHSSNFTPVKVTEPVWDRDPVMKWQSAAATHRNNKTKKNGRTVGRKHQRDWGKAWKAKDNKLGMALRFWCNTR